MTYYTNIRPFNQNPSIKDNLWIVNKSRCTNLSTIRRFHCIHNKKTKGKTKTRTQEATKKVSDLHCGLNKLPWKPLWDSALFPQIERLCTCIATGKSLTDSLLLSESHHTLISLDLTWSMTFSSWVDALTGCPIIPISSTQSLCPESHLTCCRDTKYSAFLARQWNITPKCYEDYQVECGK